MPGHARLHVMELGLQPAGVFRHSEDCGLIVVSDTEVGLFWSFSDY